MTVNGIPRFVHIYTLYDGLAGYIHVKHIKTVPFCTEDLMFRCLITSIIEKCVIVMAMWCVCVCVCIFLCQHIDLFLHECETFIDYLTSPLTGWHNNVSCMGCVLCENC